MNFSINYGVTPLTISAKIIKDSVSPTGQRITTMELKYPRFIHAEAKTHRVMSIGGEEYTLTQDAGFMSDPNLSRNASSSRAIPVEKMIQSVIDDPAMPIYWGKNQPGMQAKVELEGEEKRAAMRAWLDGMNQAVQCAQRMLALGVHKQIANRVIEPWTHITVVVTATEWNNFLHLRDHEDAQPEIAELARCVRVELEMNDPVSLKPGEWHLPYVGLTDWEAANTFLLRGRITRDMPKHPELVELLRKVSTARCARVSYLTHDGKAPDIEADLALYDRLVGSSPLHASPTEHQATPDTWSEGDFDFPASWMNDNLHGNLSGWIQHRKLLPGENVTTR